MAFPFIPQQQQQQSSQPDPLSFDSFLQEHRSIAKQQLGINTPGKEFGAARPTHTHAGIDIPGNEGETVEAPTDSKVIFAGTKRGYGNVIYLEHPDGTTSRYAHLKSFKVHEGDQIKRGVPIGILGSTGNAKGPHVHYERRDAQGLPIDPLNQDFFPLIAGREYKYDQSSLPEIPADSASTSNDSDNNNDPLSFDSFLKESSTQQQQQSSQQQQQSQQLKEWAPPLVAPQNIFKLQLPEGGQPYNPFKDLEENQKLRTMIKLRPAMTVQDIYHDAYLNAATGIGRFDADQSEAMANYLTNRAMKRSGGKIYQANSNIPLSQEDIENLRGQAFPFTIEDPEDLAYFRQFQKTSTLQSAPEGRTTEEQAEFNRLSQTDSGITNLPIIRPALEGATQFAAGTEQQISNALSRVNQGAELLGLKDERDTNLISKAANYLQRRSRLVSEAVSESSAGDDNPINEITRTAVNTGLTVAKLTTLGRLSGGNALIVDALASIPKDATLEDALEATGEAILLQKGMHYTIPAGRLRNLAIWTAIPFIQERLANPNGDVKEALKHAATFGILGALGPRAKLENGDPVTIDNIGQFWKEQYGRDIMTSPAYSRSNKIFNPEVGEKISHSNEALDGKEVVAKDSQGRVIIANEDNKTGVSKLKTKQPTEDEQERLAALLGVENDKDKVSDALKQLKSQVDSELQKNKVEGKGENKDAETIRSNEGQLQTAGNVGQISQNKGSEDLRQSRQEQTGAQQSGEAASQQVEIEGRTYTKQGEDWYGPATTSTGNPVKITNASTIRALESKLPDVEAKLPEWVKENTEWGIYGRQQPTQETTTQQQQQQLQQQQMESFDATPLTEAERQQINQDLSFESFSQEQQQAEARTSKITNRAELEDLRETINRLYTNPVRNEGMQTSSDARIRGFANQISHAVEKYMPELNDEVVKLRQAIDKQDYSAATTISEKIISKFGRSMGEAQHEAANKLNEEALYEQLSAKQKQKLEAQRNNEQGSFNKFTDKETADRIKSTLTNINPQKNQSSLIPYGDVMAKKSADLAYLAAYHIEDLYHRGIEPTFLRVKEGLREEFSNLVDNITDEQLKSWYLAGKRYYDSNVADPFFSKMKQDAVEKLPNRFNASQAADVLMKHRDEFAWTAGLHEFLRDNKDSKITKEELLDIINKGQVRVEESVASEIDTTEYKRLQKLYNEVTKQLDDQSLSDEDLSNILKQQEELGDRLDDIREGDRPKYSLNAYTGEKLELPGAKNSKEVKLITPINIGDWSRVPELDRVKEHTGGYKVNEYAWRNDIDGRIEFNEADKISPRFTNTREYTSPHWDEPNVVAHYRSNDRTTTDNQRIYFSEEFQSDWNHDIRERGIKYDSNPQLAIEHAKKMGYKAVQDEDGTWYIRLVMPDRVKAYGYKPTEEEAWRSFLNKQGVEANPFMQHNWKELVLKRFLRDAAIAKDENGNYKYDGVGWTTARQQLERYGKILEGKHFRWSKNSDGTYSFELTNELGRDLGDQVEYTNWQQPHELQGISLERFAELTTPEAAQEVRDQEARQQLELDELIKQRNIIRSVPSTDNYELPIDVDVKNKSNFKGQFSLKEAIELRKGSGDKYADYDIAYKNILSKIGKRFGAKYSQKEVTTPDPYDDVVGRSAESQDVNQKIHYLEITPPMRQSLEKEGLPLYGLGGSEPLKAPEYGTRNRLVTSEDANNARMELRKFLDPNRLHDITDLGSALPSLIKLGAYHIEAGAREFSSWVKKLASDLSQEQWDVVSPHLPDLYAASKQHLDSIYGPAAVEKITSLIKEAAKSRSKTESLYTEERSKRIQNFSKTLFKGYGEDSALSAMGELKGELPKDSFQPIRKEISSHEADALYSMIGNAQLGRWEKVKGVAGLRALLNPDVTIAPSESELSVLQKVYGKDFVKAVQSLRSKGQVFWDEFLSITNIPRTIMASFDLSAPFRQGMILSAAHPVKAARSFAAMVKAFGSEDYADQVMRSITSSPLAEVREKAGLYQSHWGAIGDSASAKEEFYAISGKSGELLHNVDRWLENKLSIGAGQDNYRLGYKGIAASERAYLVYLNKLRADVFDNVVTSNPELTTEQLKTVAQFINYATGRGDLGMLEKAAPLLNNIFFSPRFLTSRFQTPYLAARGVESYAREFITGKSKNADFGRKMAARDFVRFVGSGTAFLALLAAAGLKVGHDPKSSDFGKIIIGNTRVDIWGGMQQPARYVAQILAGERTTLSGDTQRVPREEIISRFLRSKESPQASFIHDLYLSKKKEVNGELQGTDFLGQPVTAAQAVRQRTFPLAGRDLYESVEEDRRLGGSGITGGLLGGLGLFGFGITTITPKDVNYDPYGDFASWATRH